MSQDFRRIFYYGAQRLAIERYADLFEMPHRKFVPVGRDMQGFREGMFWEIQGHPERIPQELYYQLHDNGFEIVKFDDSFHRAYYTSRQK